MTRKRSKPEDLESSSEDDEGEEQEGEEEEDDTSSESSSEEDEFDSEDDRVNMIPSQDPDEKAPLQTAVADSSSESDEEDDTMKPAMKPVSDPSHLQKQQNVRTFDSDVESEYETESTSESEGPTQKHAKDTVQGSPKEALPPSQRKVQEARIVEDAKKGKDKTVKQQQNDPLPGKREVLRNVQEESQSARKGHGGIMREIASDDSVKDERKSGVSFKKRKLESLQHDTERDSADSAPTSKKKKDAEVGSKGKKSVSKEKAVPMPSESALEESSKSKKGTDRDKPLHDIAKEIARKTLHNGNAKVNGSQDVPDSKVSNAAHELKQEKKANSSAITQPASSSKQKKPHVWSTDEEIILALEVLNRVKMGLEVPSKRGDDFWFSLIGILQEKLGLDFSRDQLSEKVRRLKQRYQGTVQKIKDSQGSKKPYKHKSIAEQRLFDVMSQIWGKAEMVSLEGSQQGAANETRHNPSESKQNSKGDQNRKGDDKAMNVSSPKAMPKAIASKVEVAATTQNNVGADANVVSVPPKVEHVGIAKDDQGHVVLNAFADGTVLPINDAHRLLEEKVQAMLHELQEWSKRNLEEWMNKAYAQIEDSTRKFEDQVRRMSWMGSPVGGGLPLRSCDAMDIPLVHGDEGIKQQWYELQLQELNLHAQRLELMRRECELKQEQIKMQLKEKSK